MRFLRSRGQAAEVPLRAGPGRVRLWRGREGLVAVVRALAQDKPVAKDVEGGHVGDQPGAGLDRSEVLGRPRGPGELDGHLVAFLDDGVHLVALVDDELGAHGRAGAHLGQAAAMPVRADRARVLDLLGIGVEETDELVALGSVGDGLVQVQQMLCLGGHSHNVSCTT